MFNNFVLGLVYKEINAVVKYLAYAQSLWVTYLINLLLVGAAFNLDLFFVVLLLVLLVIAYSFAKVAPAPAVLDPAQGESRSLELGQARAAGRTAGTPLASWVEAEDEY